ncbi:LysR family transcriptional regulator [Rhizobium oryzicola]|uniref:LysR family transcriptional regulator n=1 Tax=Rhizobium oryzicola TaxID=1232668 RepID=A0ABT8SVR1_9HYPH|nr:LysR family transcriptional regulator [Rhizobium oryzicola]MDO1582507.1 LysR family transcriptional regulator [Rhizobium oryzicola]
MSGHEVALQYALEGRRPPAILAGMEKNPIELRLLASFISACQNSRISDTAASLGHTTSALSTALHKLEERMGLKLFVRHGGHLHLTAPAFWLFRHGCELLMLEDYARRACRQPPDHLNKLIVMLDLSLAIGRFSKALIKATQDMMRLHADTWVEWRFADASASAAGEDAEEQMDSLFGTRVEHVRIAYDEAEGVVSARGHLYDDAWIVAGGHGTDLDIEAGGEPAIVMKMRPSLLKALSTHMEGRSLSHRLRYIDAEPARFGELLVESPHHRFLMPASMLAERMGLTRIDWVPLTPGLISPLSGHVLETRTGRGASFLNLLADSLKSEIKGLTFEPRLSMRQVSYFNLTCSAGGISAAARVANLAQSSISAQIQKMETAIGCPLLERRGDGLVLSQQGGVALRLSRAMEDRQATLVRQALDLAAHAQARIRIGTLPSSGHDSVMTEKIAKVVTSIHSAHPNWLLQVSEGSNSLLHEKVKSGDLHLAIVGSAEPQVARIPLGPTEALSVVARPDFQFPEGEELALEQVCSLPMVLGVRHLSIHQSLMQVARARNCSLNPVIEVGSLALAIAIVRHSPLCTVLPASSVRKDVKAGLLKARRIRRDEIPGALSVIFSASRSLSEPERVLIQAFQRVFKGNSGDWADALDEA